MSKNTNTTKATPATEAKAPRVPANCGCGCGQPTVTTKATFVAGHDARLAGVLGRAMAAGPLTDAQQKQYDSMSDRLRTKADGVRATAERKIAEKDARAKAAAAAKEAYAAALAAAK